MTTACCASRISDSRAVELAPAVAGSIERELGTLELVLEPSLRPPLRLLETGNAGEHTLCAWARSHDHAGVGELRPLRLADRVRGVAGVEVEHFGKRRSEPCSGLGEPDRVHVRAEQVLVRQIESGWAHLSGDHELRAAEEVLVVRVPGRAVVEDERGLAASSRTPAALRVVRGGRRDVPHVDDIELGDVHPKLHRR